MKIRTMNVKDYSDICDLWLSCEGMGLNNLDESQQGIEKFLTRNPTTCFVAEDSEHIVGGILAGYDGRRGYIYHVALSPSHRRKGVGSALVQRALSALREEGISKTALLVFRRNEDGNAFWEREGFTQREDIVYRDKALMEVVRRDT